MKKSAFFYLSFFIFTLPAGPLRGLDEKTLVIGGASGWRLAEKTDGLVEISSVRPHPVLALSSASLSGGSDPGGLSAPDMVISFDEGSPGRFADSAGHYRVSVSRGVQAADGVRARMGAGAALFQAGAASAVLPEPLLVEPSDSGALFAPGRRIGDFSLEFWLYPFHMENGEQILEWTASGAGSRPGTEGGFQRILCMAVKNRLHWTFSGFFVSSNETERIDLSLSGGAPVVPDVWTHHLVRFESDTGLLEYLVNGRSEAITYASPSGREGGEVYLPLAGDGGSFNIGKRFSGLVDELELRGQAGKPGAKPELQKYRRSGRFQTGPLDLGRGGDVIRVDALGGRTRAENGARRNIYGGGFNYPDNAAVRFYIRSAANPYYWAEADWQPFFPGRDMPETRGRYVQLAADFYPSGDGETSPYLEELRIVYRPDDPPPPPVSVTAVARDGAVELSWKPGPGKDTAGYLVYYGTSRGEYFGEDAILGASPVDAGKSAGLRVEGLSNGVLYYFAVAAYDTEGAGGSSFRAGAFSREVGARPAPEPLVQRRP
ncbi:MAG: fibronectin type III domain-containing protein [Treponema sp.]|jgi:hypothetical protein|nr:fibronectin type III domain-containing protein [Treponema sp.]